MNKLIMLLLILLSILETLIFAVLHPIRTYRIIFKGDPDDELAP